MTTTKAILDLRGVECPDFNLALRSYFRATAADTVVLIRATVHNAKRDVVRLCDFGGHVLLAERSVDDVVEFIVKAGV